MDVRKNDHESIAFSKPPKYNHLWYSPVPELPHVVGFNLIQAEYVYDSPNMDDMEAPIIMFTEHLTPKTSKYLVFEHKELEDSDSSDGSGSESDDSDDDSDRKWDEWRNPKRARN